jgi:hypothetical protein
MKTRSLALAFAASLVFAGCGGIGPDTGDSGTPPADLGSAAVTPHFSSLMGDYLQNCASCHAPGAPGRTSSTEMTLDFSSNATAYQSITTGMTSGLVGNQAGCEGVPFLTSMKPAQSLLVAVLDSQTRAAFDLPAFASCDATAISDETVKVGSAPSAAFLTALNSWVQAGAPND